ncbi:hypothetical protein CQS04_06995 [Chryseomicrobium excrementi]|uniref:Uncharacterized protein n=1 Tax=Chryseomicrobium excrementi TaxID=2041346 RepID=A0A2M9F0A7_9BACL|nr:hypothetical protein CQS04_06995 [Chryseomicrobium excrementi]
MGDDEESGFDAEQTAPLADETQLDEEQTPLPCTRTPAHPLAPSRPHKNPLATKGEGVRTSTYRAS